MTVAEAAAVGNPSSIAEARKRRTVWLVFARRKYDEPIYEVGAVTAENPDMAAVFARSIYDEHPWIEMMVVPRSSSRTVIAP